MYKFGVSTVPADGLAPLGARTSAGTGMSQVQVPWIYSYGIQRVNFVFSYVLSM